MKDNESIMFMGNPFGKPNVTVAKISSHFLRIYKERGDFLSYCRLYKNMKIYFDYVNGDIDRQVLNI